MSQSTKKILSLAGALILMIGFRYLPSGDILTKDGMAVLGIFLGSLLLWITVSIDWPSLLTILFIGFIPSFGFGATLKGAFGNSTVAFLLFTFMLVYPLSQTNFVRRCTVAFITNPIAKKGPWHFVIFLLAAVTFLGLFISPSVLFVAFLPFLEDILAVLELKKGSKTGSMLTMGTAICISLSSGMTAIGHVWPTLAMGYYASATGNEISQFQYLCFGIPTGLILVALLILIFRFLYRPNDIKDLRPEKAAVLKGTVPKADRKEWIILGSMVLTVLLWVVPSLIKGIAPEVYTKINSWTTAMPPLLGCLILFVCEDNKKPILSFKEATSKGVLWGAIFMTAAATQLGSCITSDATGISAWLSSLLSNLTQNLSPIVLVFIFVAWCIVETNFSSNIVTTTVVSSVALTVISALPEGTVNMAAVLCLVGFGAAVCNMTPAGQSTVNTVAIGSGWTSTKDMFVWGGVFAIAAILVLSFVGYPLASVLM